MNLEDDLRRALRRKDAPPDFANRVIARVEPASPKQTVGGGRLLTFREAPITRWFAAAAMLTLVVGGGARYYEYQQNVAEAKRVQAEVMLAMEVTSQALARVQEKLQARAR